MPGPLNGSKVVFKVFIRPLYTCLRPLIKRWADRNKQTFCDFDKEVQDNLADIQSGVIGGASEYFVKKAMEGLAKGEGN